MFINWLYDIQIFLKRASTILRKRTLLWLNPHLERFTATTKANPTYFLANSQPHLQGCFGKTFNPIIRAGGGKNYITIPNVLNALLHLQVI